jgi:hypothetical protein
MAVLKSPLLFRLAPEYFIVLIGVEWRVNVDEVYASVRQARKLL